MLATEIDDVVDYLEEASDLLGLYGVELPTRHAVEQCAIIVKAVERLALACANLKGMRGVQQALIELKSLEDQGDRCCATRRRRCFATTDHPLIVMLEGHLRGPRARPRRLRDGRERDREHRRRERVDDGTPR